MPFSIFQVTHLPAVPPVVFLLAKHPSVDNFDLSYLTEVTNGAAPLGKQVSKALMDRLPLLSSVRQGKCILIMAMVIVMAVFLTFNGIEKCVVDRFSDEMDELEQIMSAN